MSLRTWAFRHRAKLRRRAAVFGRGVGRKPLEAIYAGIVSLVAMRLRRFPSVCALYLRRGCALGEITPGVSDIDFIVFTCDVLAEHEVSRIQAAYARMAAWLPLLEEDCPIYAANKMAWYMENSPSDRYLFEEGRRIWRRIYGSPLLEILDPIPLKETLWGWHAEMHRWWAQFISETLLPAAAPEDSIWRQSICYKATAETLRYALALRGAQWVSTRAEAIAKGYTLTDLIPPKTLSALEASQKAGFLPVFPALRQQALDCLLNALPALHSESMRGALLRDAAPFSLEPDAPEKEIVGFGELRRHATKTVLLASEKWKELCAEATLSPSLFVGMDEAILILVPSAIWEPNDQDLADCIAFFQQECARFGRRIHLFLWKDSIALQIGAFAHDSHYWRSLLSPELSPDLFALLNTQSFFLKGSPSFPAPAPLRSEWTFNYWRNFQNDEWHWEKEAALLMGEDHTLPALEFLRTWWKALQLLLVSYGYSRPHWRTPFTPAATVRALQREGLETPALLVDMERAYWSAVRGETQNLDALRKEATLWLCTIAAQLAQSAQPETAFTKS